MLILRKGLPLSIASLLCASASFAQIDVGGVTGTVKDPTGATQTKSIAFYVN